MKIYKLNVPYSEKEEAKKLGAKWDFDLKTWYIFDSNDSSDLSKFERWNPIFQDWLEAVKNEDKPKKVAKAESKFFARTGKMFVAFCECISPPWEHCKHSTKS